MTKSFKIQNTCSKMFSISCALILVMRSQLLILIERFRIEKIEYLKNET